MSLKEIRDAEIEYCKENPVYFVEEYGHIENKESEDPIIPFRLWEEQRKTLETFRDDRFVIVMKARQLGFTWLALHYITWVLLRPGRSAIGISENEDKAKELIRRTSDVILRNMGALIRPKESKNGWDGDWYESSALKIIIHHPGKPDSVFECFPSSPNAGRSFTADVLLFDEWAFQQFDREIYGAAFATINRATSGQIIGISSIKRGSLFEELYTGENDYTKIFIPWYADPSRDDEWYRRTRTNLSDPVLMTAEYPATVEEALTVPGGAFFPDGIPVTDEELTGNTVTYYCMDYGMDMLAGLYIKVDTDGNAQIIEEIHERDLTIPAAAEMINTTTERLGERPVLYLAPTDLWNRSQVTGKGRNYLFEEEGISLTKVNRDIASGCAAIKMYIAKGKLSVLRGCAPNLIRCMAKIQRDQKRPDIYANKPHELTHIVDALRYFCNYWISNAESPINSKRIKWREDMYEDYYNASDTDKKILIEKWGEPA